jgi:ABC-2 type transport system permease protein
MSVEAPLSLETRIWYNPELESTLFLVTGLIVFILMITTTISTSLSVVREREQGTMEQLMVSPLNSASVIIGKTVPYLFVAILSTVFILFISYLAFGVVVKGSYLLLAVSSFVFILAALSQGIFISTVTTSQQVAFFIAALSTLLPAMLLSGFVFPIASMPFYIQWITKVLPATYFVTLLRAVIMKGSGFDGAWDHLLALMLFSAITIIISAIRLKKMKVV